MEDEFYEDDRYYDILALVHEAIELIGDDETDRDDVLEVLIKIEDV